MLSFKEFLDAKAEYKEYSKGNQQSEDDHEDDDHEHEDEEEYVPCDEPHTHNDEGDCVVKAEGNTEETPPVDKKQVLADEIKAKIEAYAKAV